MSTDAEAIATPEPATKFGNTADEMAYMMRGATLAEPSLINTNSKFLNSPFFRDAFAQIALRRNGPDVPSTYVIPLAARAIGEVTDYPEFQQLLDEEKEKKPEFAEWLRARRYTSFKRDDVKDYAPGTLGHAIWELLGITGIEMELQMKGLKPQNDIDYISKRRGTIHDIEHIVTGFDANAAGEIGVAWQYIASASHYFSPELAHHISAGLNLLGNAALMQASLHYPGVYPTFLVATQQGIAMGLAMKRPLLVEPWEDMLDWTLDAIASHLGIVRGPGKAWDWTDAASTG